VPTTLPTNLTAGARRLPEIMPPGKNYCLARRSDRTHAFGLSAPTHPRTSKKHGNRQADDGGQVFHTGSVAETVWDG
jgi:hypothetical protein